MSRLRAYPPNSAHVDAVKEELLALFSDALLVCDENQTIVYSNEGACTLFGYGRTELVGRPVADLVPAPWRARHGELMQQFAERGGAARDMRRRLPVLCQRKDGTTIKAAGTIAHVTLEGHHFYGVILRDLTEMEETLHDLAQKERQLEKALTEAQIAAQARSNFLATMSHELRTPLNAILGFSELILSKKGQGDPAVSLDYVGDIHKSGLKLLSLVEEILAFTSLRSEVIRLDEKQHDLQDLVNAAITDCAKIIADRDIVVNLETRDRTTVKVDRSKMVEAFKHVLSNAVKFSPPGSLVLVRVTHAPGGETSISFQDNGIGIPAADIERLQAPFERADPSSAARFEGVGLGLAITKAIADMHGATLEISSMLGRGTTVSIHLPEKRVVKGETEILHDSPQFDDIGDTGDMHEAPGTQDRTLIQ